MSVLDPTSQLVPTEEFLRMARQQGIDINHRTLRLYASQGLLPHATVRNLASGGRSGFYPRDVLQTLFLIGLLKERGHTLKEIQAMLGRLAEVARQRNVPPTVIHAELAMNLEGAAEPAALAGKDYWRPVSRLVAEELIRRGRRAGHEDIEAIELIVHLKGTAEKLPVLLYLSLEDGAFRPPRPEERAQLREFIPEGWAGDPADALLAEWEGRPIGFAALAAGGLVHRPGHMTMVGPFVRPGFRNQGVGGRLLEHLAARARQRGALGLEAAFPADATGSADFLSRHGFAVTGSYWQVVHSLDRGPTVGLPPGYEIRPYEDLVHRDHLAALGQRLAPASSEPRFTAPDIARESDQPLFRSWLNRLCMVFRGEVPVGFLWVSADGQGLVELIPEEMGNPVYEAALGWLIAEAAKRRAGELKARLADAGHDTFNRAAALGFEIEQRVVVFERQLARPAPQ